MSDPEMKTVKDLYPLAFIRPDDWAIFELNENKTYSLRWSKLQFPDALHIEFPRNTLRTQGFHEVYKSLNEYQLPKERNCGDDE